MVSFHASSVLKRGASPLVTMTSHSSATASYARAEGRAVHPVPSAARASPGSSSSLRRCQQPHGPAQVECRSRAQPPSHELHDSAQGLAFVKLNGLIRTFDPEAGGPPLAS